ncbi:unnamed protein product [Clavelina lepadiformis]|uniref:Uncharacterized protein n=1 Tax=Clavelina lepadiformis TaxID=159417 RepID=A0ABP0FJI9_CLALP
MSKLDKLALFRPNLPKRVSSQTPLSHFSRPLTTFDTQQDELISKVITTFNEENIVLTLPAHSIGTLYKAIGKIFPIEILTKSLQLWTSAVPSYCHLHTKAHLTNVLSSSTAIKTATVNTVNSFQTTLSYREYTIYWNRIDQQEVLSSEFWDTPSFITTILYRTSMCRCTNSTYLCCQCTSTSLPCT